MSNPHYFIAAELPADVKEKIEKQKKQWSEKFKFKQWTHMEDLHITLAFLGAADEKEIEQYQRYLKEKIPELPAADLVIERTDYFGREANPRIFWIGPKDELGLQTLYNLVQQIVAKAGGTTEKRPYRPHITLAKKWIGNETFQLPESIQAIDFTVSSVALYRIHPAESPKYEVVARFMMQQ
ncbi:RNA 2',3'-cyclic phosphodiesterase [Jeotgalibacillus sp. S-D1]|uniref:RNA 2',3'-cyclic phosphodiesterase n=1 Tax=Jeotgalibacillus sp. S-D1 TaxID=2552189 RepID=UPI0014043504|nr:RNA 2',3'-cyclic phosphodiesterase [Jeotgalibacillus sp. S-D1]